MKIIIEHGRTKREINGLFNICGSEEDLRNIATQILRKLEIGHYYGWIKVIDEQSSIANTPPLPWD